MDGVEEGKPSESEVSKTPTFRQIAERVWADKSLNDPFSDGTDNPTDDRDAFKAILIKHYGYTLEEIEDLGDDTCKFFGSDRQAIKVKTGQNEKAEPYFDLEVEGRTTGSKRIFSPSLVYGTPLIIALAHQPVEKLIKILGDSTGDPKVVQHKHTMGSKDVVIQLEINYDKPLPHTTAWSLKKDSFIEAHRWATTK